MVENDSTPHGKSPHFKRRQGLPNVAPQKQEQSSFMDVDNFLKF